MERDAPLAALDALVDELATTDPEHGDVAVSDESGWTLTAFGDGRLLWENVEETDGEERLLFGVPREEVVRLFRLVASGELESVDRLPWRRRGA
jgi:hypothetical protein